MQWTTCDLVLHNRGLSCHQSEICASLKGSNFLVCFSLPFPCVALLTLLTSSSPFLHPSSSSHFTSFLHFFSSHPCTFSFVDSFTSLMFRTHFLLLLFSSYLLHFTISNPPPLKQSHIIKYYNSYHMVIFTINYVTATPTTVFVIVSEKGLQSAPALTHFFFCPHK